MGDSHSYYASYVMRVGSWVAVALSLFSIVVHLVEPDGWSILIVPVQLCMAGGFTWMGWDAWTRPLFTTSSEGLGISEGKRNEFDVVPWEEISGLKWTNRGAICLARHGESAVTLNLFLLARRDREALRQLVSQRFAPGGESDVRSSSLSPGERPGGGKG